MFEDIVDRFKTGVRDLRGRLIEYPSRKWAAAGKAASVEQRERKERKAARREAERKARDAMRMEKFVRRNGAWFPSDGPP